MAAAPETTPHDSGGSSTNARAPFESISTRGERLAPWLTPTRGPSRPRRRGRPSPRSTRCRSVPS
jgi:hypothetical protein